MLSDELKRIVGDGGWTTDAHELEPHLTEWRDTWHGETLIMVTPDSTEKVAAIVAACRFAGVAIVPQGGNTGLCGGAIPDRSGEQVLLSLSRMNRVRSISPDDHSMVVEAGCTLASVQQAAADSHRYVAGRNGQRGRVSVRKPAADPTADVAARTTARQHALASPARRMRSANTPVPDKAAALPP